MNIDNIYKVKINGTEMSSMQFDSIQVWEKPPYTKIKYLKSYNDKNSGQYIDLNVSGLTNGSIAEFEMMIDNVAPEFSYIFGAENGYFPYNRAYFKRNSAGNVNAYELGAYNCYNFYASSMATGKKVKVKVSTIKGNSYVYFDDVLQTSTTDNNDRTSGTYGLFALIRGGTQMESNFRGKIYWFKLWNSNNELIRDMIPVLDENNIPCMYDRITKTYFYNQGTGTFTYEE